MTSNFLKLAFHQFRSWSRWVRVSVGIVFVGAMLAAAAWVVIPIVIARGLEAEIGKRSFPDTRREAEEANEAALSGLSPKLLVDVPETALSPGIESAMATAAKDLVLPDGVFLAVKAPASVTFFDDAIRMRVPVLLTHPKWGTVDLSLQVDAVPKIVGETLVVTLVPSVPMKVRHLSPGIFRLEGAEGSSHSCPCSRSRLIQQVAPSRSVCADRRLCRRHALRHPNSPIARGDGRSLPRTSCAS